MALVKYLGTEYNAKELRIVDNSIKMLLNDNKNVEIQIDDNKIMDIEVHGNIEKSKISGCVIVSGNIDDGYVENNLIIDGNLSKFNESTTTNITRLKESDLDKIGFNSEDKNVLKLYACGTLNYFEDTIDSYIVNIHGRIGYIECKRSLKVCGNINRIKVNKQVIGTLSLRETNIELEKRKEEEHKILNETQKLLSNIQKDFS